MIFDAKVLPLVSALMITMVHCGGGGGHHSVTIKAQYPHHTEHKHHTERIPEVKIIKVPVVKEVKVPHPYKVHYKVPVPYIIKQEIHTVPVHKYPVHTSQHIHHPPSKAHHSYGSSKSFTSHAASNIAPMIVSHTAVGSNPHDTLASFMSAHQSTPRAFHAISSKSSTPTYITGLNTSIQPVKVGFGSQEGEMTGYEVQEAAELGQDAFAGHNFEALNEEYTQAASKARSMPAPAYPYPFPDVQTGNSPLEYSFGFSPSDSLYAFDSFH